MGFEVQPEILEINEIEGLSTDLQNLNTGATNLLNQTNSLSGSIPESSKNLVVQITLNGQTVTKTFAEILGVN